MYHLSATLVHIPILQTREKFPKATEVGERLTAPIGYNGRVLLEEEVDSLLVMENNHCSSKDGDRANGTVKVLESEPVQMFRQTWRRNVLDVADDREGPRPRRESQCRLFSREQAVGQEGEDDEADLNQSNECHLDDVCDFQ